MITGETTGLGEMKQTSKRTILVPLDRSELSERALGPARQLAHSMNASIVLLSILPDQDPSFIVHSDMIASTDEYLNGIADRLRARDVQVVTQVRVGSAATCIVDQATLWHSSLIVMSTHGHGGLSLLVHGSVAESVVRASPVPVLLVPARGEKQPTLHGDTIVVAVDGSIFAEMALAHAVEMARELTLSVVIVSAVTWPMLPVESAMTSVSMLDATLAESRAYVNRLVESVRRVDIDARGEVTIGQPATVILDVAEKANAAVIAMATHGRGGLERMAFGSVAMAVLSRTTRPLVLTRPQHAPLTSLVDVHDVAVATNEAAHIAP